ncbi:TetR/AcrR family transcriptional regulator [Rhizobium leguminosarum]|uniref:TetR/AcrR family transcriptional regulator n=1 Tax=Rhizobium leguminosarum TaxID=384 RepID=UPI000FF48AD8|nr:TetR/AcrR family transcriptional regulator [Rhizobium leguminosarum]RWY90689.1 TetR/AcrR family transcriptional regulator [Rhizobium leguminosarum]
MGADMKAVTAAARKMRAVPDTRAKILKAAREEFSQHGFAGARTERILSTSGANPRMLYHHFGGKSGLYVVVLEEALFNLRQQELKIDVDHLNPLEGLIALFEHIHQHFDSDLRLVQLLRNENVEKAKHLKTSQRVREMSSPVLKLIADFLARGAQDGSVRTDVDPLHYYVTMVALCQFHLSNAHTLSFIFDQDLTKKDWRKAHLAFTIEMVKAFLRPLDIPK